MPTYHDILAAGAVRFDALIGPQKAQLETTYTTRPLTAANFQSTVFPFSDALASILWAEQQIAAAVADTGNSSLRSYLASRTANILNGGRIPSVDENGVPIIGIYGAVKDATSGRVYYPKALAEIERRVENPTTFWVVPVYFYRQIGTSIYHTGTNVKLDVCVYDSAVQQAAIAADGEILFPTLEPLYVDGMLSRDIRDDEFMAQTAVYNGYFQNGLAAIRQGEQSISGMTRPSPMVAA